MRTYRDLKTDAEVEATCKSCAFFDSKHDICRKNPPLVQILASRDVHDDPCSETVTTWPEVEADDWCGEFDDDQAEATVEFDDDKAEDGMKFDDDE